MDVPYAAHRLVSRIPNLQGHLKLSERIISGYLLKYLLSRVYFLSDGLEIEKLVKILNSGLEILETR